MLIGVNILLITYSCRRQTADIRPTQSANYLVLPEKRNHPFAQGWSFIFKQWAKLDVVREGRITYRPSYSQSFRTFAESDAVGL